MWLAWVLFGLAIFGLAFRWIIKAIDRKTQRRLDMIAEKAAFERRGREMQAAEAVARSNSPVVRKVDSSAHEIQFSINTVVTGSDEVHSVYDDADSFFLAGVTFANIDGSSRQDTLRVIAESKSQKAKATLVIGEYQGNPTVEVWAKSKQVGFAPKEQVSDILEFLEGGEYSARITAFGGEDGRPYTGKVEYVRRDTD